MPVKVLSSAANNGYLNYNVLERMKNDFKKYSKILDSAIKKEVQELLLSDNLDKELFVYSNNPFDKYQDSLSKKN